MRADLNLSLGHAIRHLFFGMAQFYTCTSTYKCEIGLNKRLVVYFIVVIVAVQNLLVPIWFAQFLCRLLFNNNNAIYIVLTLKAPNKNCSRQDFNFLP